MNALWWGLLAISAAGAGGAVAGGSAAASDPAASMVLYDARDQDLFPTGVERHPRLDAAEQTRVLSKLAARFVTSEKACGPNDRVYYRTGGRAHGAFTTPGTRQTAYVVESVYCRPEYRVATEAMHLLIFQGQALVARAEGKGMVRTDEDGPHAFYGKEIRGVPDVDGDGVDELLVTSEGFAMGVVEQVARLYTARGARVRRLEEFQGTYVDTCTSGSDERVEALVIRYARGPAPRFTTEPHVAPCDDGPALRPSDFRPR